MNLVIDVGNTLVKVGVFENEILKEKKSFPKEELLTYIENISLSFPDLKNVLIAQVGKLDEDQVAQLQKRFSLLYLDQNTKVPFINSYGTPQTLGVDRIALVSAAAKHYPFKDALVIDAGTCITYDFISASNEYFGGAISPGIGLRYQALHSFTHKLPLLNKEIPDDLIGNSTTSSIHSGVIGGIVNEIDGFIENYKIRFPDLTVILTGGDAQFLRESIKNDIFANSNFLLEGLNHILEYNVH